jgi:hypothetical protein
MKRLTMIAILGVLTMGTMGGCAADVATPGESAALVEHVSRADLESRDLYYDPLISARPMTAEELGDTSGAVRIRLQFLDSVAVAWAAPDGEPLVGRPGAIVALFGFSNVEPIDGELSPGSTVPTEPAHPGALVRDDVVGTRVDLGDDAPAIATLRRFSIPDVWVRWSELFREDPEVIRDLGRYHPGCI